MNRIFNIIMTELTSDILKAEEDMETIINTKENSHDKVSKIKECLNKIVLSEKMLEKWKSYTSTDNKIKNT